MAKKILLSAVAVLVATALVICVLASRKPDEFRVERSITIAAPAARLFPYADDLSLWQEWSPWEKLDPAMSKSISVPPLGKGATYDWKGNKQVGSGRMEIVESIPLTKVVYRLQFLEPFKSESAVTVAFTPNAEKTDVSWTMSGPMPFMSKIMCVFMDMDAMIGKDFERGLANLKAKAETAPLSAKR